MRVSLTRIVFTVILALALWIFASLLARADVRILASPGGQVGDFSTCSKKCAIRATGS